MNEVSEMEVWRERARSVSLKLQEELGRIGIRSEVAAGSEGADFLACAKGHKLPVRVRATGPQIRRGWENRLHVGFNCFYPKASLKLVYPEQMRTFSRTNDRFQFRQLAGLIKETLERREEIDRSWREAGLEVPVNPASLS